MKRFSILLIIVWQIYLPAHAQTSHTSLNGNWFFALDPLKIGVQNDWTAPSFPDKILDEVTVPHCYSVDKRYFFHTGTAWYFKTFDALPLKKDSRAFIKFDAVFYKTNVWLNGKQVRIGGANRPTDFPGLGPAAGFYIRDDDKTEFFLFIVIFHDPFSGKRTKDFYV